MTLQEPRREIPPNETNTSSRDIVRPRYLSILSEGHRRVSLKSGPGLRRCRASYLLGVVLCGDDEDLQAQRGPPQLLPLAPQTAVLLLTAALQPLHLEHDTGEHGRVQENMVDYRRTW